MVDERFKEPSSDTRVRVQGDKDTAHGEGSANDMKPPWNEGDVLGEFVLEKQLGRGTSGFVYRAMDQRVQRRCALKLLMPMILPEDLVRNKLGFRRMMSIEHPSLLKVHRIHQLDKTTAMSMEEVHGKTLNHAVKELKKLDAAEAYSRLVRLTRDYAAGLAVMHVNGYVHRDIKPQNLMVDSEGHGRIIDYGLVGTFDPETDPNGYRHYLAGTPRYFSPETLWYQHYLPAGDIFSLGVVMLEALHTIKWEHEEDVFKRSEKSSRDDAENLSEAIEGLDQSVPDELREMCLEMLQREPGERPTAMEVARVGLTTTLRFDFPQETSLVGRRQERTTALNWLDDIYDGGVGRLHITGRSGIGKTRLVDEIERYAHLKRWGQVFRVRCRSRENQPLQAFDQVCDEIANRYRRGDREPLELDTVSATILHNIFPVLKNVLQCSMKMVPPGTSTERLDALEAAARLSVQLRKVGPVVVILDDAQWADRDSLNALDRLQTAQDDRGLGIITVSRDAEDPQRLPASCRIDVTPLSESDSKTILKAAAERWDVGLSDKIMDRLIEVAEGVPFRLHELADEFRPGRALADLSELSTMDASVQNVGQIQWLWQHRRARLSEEAYQVLLYVVTAGCKVSTEQLGRLTTLGDAVDAAVSELAQQRLVIDDATGGECIQIVHDQVADSLVETLTGEEKRKAHQAWAALLVREDHPERLAARIAGHFIAAEQPWRAVSYAVLAAEEAERLVAMTEAARWHAMVVNHVKGKEKITRIRHAARCFHQADRPVEAAEYYRQLLEHVDENERVECRLLIASLSIRSGRFEDARQQVQQLARVIGLPRRKSSLVSKLSLGYKTLSVMVRELISRNESIEEKLNKPPRSEGEQAHLAQQQLRVCVTLARPMSMFENLHSAELNMMGLWLAQRDGTAAQRVHAIVGRSVFGCYDRGNNRVNSETALYDIRPFVKELGNPRASGDMWAGVAYSHALSHRWQQVPETVDLSVKHYAEVTDSNGFEMSHTRWLAVWAHWHLGSWSKMFDMADLMLEDAIRRNDLFQQLILCEGYGCSAWLARDRVAEWDRLATHRNEVAFGRSTQLFHIFSWIASVHRAIYEGLFDTAWQHFKQMESEVRQLPYSKLQLLRVVQHSLGALTALHLFRREQSPRWARRVEKQIRRLRNERLKYASVVADLYDGLYRMFRAETPEQVAVAEGLLKSASCDANELGLKPFQLAADDALSRVGLGESMGMLRERMKARGVVRPMLFERLYTVT